MRKRQPGPTAAERREACRRRYEEATAGAMGGACPVDLHAATGDPLAVDEPELAARAYGLAGAPRPSVALRRAHEAVHGNGLHFVAQMAAGFPRWWTNIRRAEEAVALAAERGLWIGNLAPVSFAQAVKLTRTRMAQPVDHAAAGDTGRRLLVAPVPGAGASSSTRSYVPMTSPTSVPDTLFWRRRISDGTVRLIKKEGPERKKGK